jgi:hypothetical protein
MQGDRFFYGPTIALLLGGSFGEFWVVNPASKPFTM